MRENIVLLTSTIQPKTNQPDLVLIDPLLRLDDYKKALTFYFDLLHKNIIQKIVFVDNSGFNLAQLKNDFSSPNIEFISFYGLDYPQEYHRGFGEFSLIEHAFSASKFLLNMSPKSIVWKISGRYIVKNLKSIIYFSPKKFDLYLDTRKDWVELSVMAWNSYGYTNCINGVQANFKLGFPPEIILARKLKENRPTNVKILWAFVIPAYLIARRGTDGEYFEKRFTKLKFIIKAFLAFITWPYRNYISNI